MRYVYLLMILLTLGCSRKPEDGHYHVVQETPYVEYLEDYINVSSYASFLPSVGMIDIKGKEVILDANTIIETYTEYLSEKDGYMLDRSYNTRELFQTKMIDDTLHLYSDNARIKAIKCEENCYSREEDFFYSAKLEINLPLSTDTLKMLRYEATERPISIDLFIGKLSKKKYPFNHHNHRLRMKCDDLYCTIEDLKIWLKKWKIALPYSMRDKFLIHLFLDKTTPTSKVRKVLAELEGENISLAFKSGEDYGNFQVWLLPISQISDTIPDTNERLNNWLKTQFK